MSSDDRKQQRQLPVNLALTWGETFEFAQHGFNTRQLTAYFFYNDSDRQTLAIPLIFENRF